ncbi:hypothetical protein GNG26_10025 [Leclercia sp. J807]|uniref:hypothetical protein n=1 Tax=Leclercia sp. J807 TaxID=2681307 RepID=UPI0012E12D1D|nr:hypothetical protein [Leclercia sp. J807]QGU10670.1 hypothetical protein GNG26_10025 [Leclercia sp. J807]
MKIVNKKQFHKLPANTVYSRYKSCLLGDLEIKGNTIGRYEFMNCRITNAVDMSDPELDKFDILVAAEDDGVSFGMDFAREYPERLFEEDELFAVWEKDDVVNLIARLSKCL